MTPCRPRRRRRRRHCAARVLQEAGIAGGAPSLEDARGREDHRRCADRGDRPPAVMQSPHEFARCADRSSGDRRPACRPAARSCRSPAPRRRKRRVRREPDAVRAVSPDFPASEATTTSMPARRSMSMMVTASSSSKPSANGTSTRFIAPSRLSSCRSSGRQSPRGSPGPARRSAHGLPPSRAVPAAAGPARCRAGESTRRTA